MSSILPFLPGSAADVLQRLFPGDSKMARCMRNFDWPQTGLGAAEAWPQSLKTSVRIMLASRQPTAVWWSEHFLHLYNDSYAALLCGKHPEALGQPASSVWSEIWDRIGPRAEFALYRDEEICDPAQPVILMRNGYPEEAYLAFAYTPIRDDDGDFGGILCTVGDATQYLDTIASHAPRLSAFSDDALHWRPVAAAPHNAQAPNDLEAPAGRLPSGAEELSKTAGARLLVVDDNDDLRNHLTQLLASRWTVESAPDGKAALDILRREPFDLILTDVMMPQLDGFGLLQELRADPLLQALPVIMLSARSGEESSIEGLYAGADDYLIKPFSAQEVIARVETHLKLSAIRRHLAAENAALLQLHEVSVRLLSEDALPTLLQAVVDAAITVSGAAKGTLQLYDAASQALHIVAQRGFQQAFLDHFAVIRADDATACGETLRRGERVIVENITQSPLFLDSSVREVTAAAGVHAVQCMPLRARDGVLLGTLATHWIEPHRPNASTLRILDLLAREAADLIEHRRRDAALQESQEQLLKTQQHLQAIMQAVPVGISFSDDRGCQRITGNPAFFAQFEMQPGDNISASAPDSTARGRQVRYLQNGKAMSDTELPLQRAVAENREIPPMELEVILPGGRRWFTEASGAPIRNTRGEVTGGVAVSVDITERKRAEKALQQAVGRYEWQVRLFEGITSATPDFVYLFDLSGRFVYANRRLLEVWGLELLDIIGKNCLELGYEQWHHDMHMREIAQVIATKRSIKGEIPFKAPRTGIFGVYEYIFTPVLDPDGKVEFVAGTSRDVTERKRAEEALIESEARFQRMADGAPILLWVSGTDKLYTYFNKPWLEFTGRTMQQELGNGWAEGIHPDDFERCLEIYTSSFDARQPFTMEYRLRRHDGEYRWLLDSGVPLYGPGENFVGYIGSCLDISERKQMEEALREADRRKDEFLATLAHELRNPLAPLRNALHILRLSGADARTAEHTYVMMERQVNHLVRLVDDLLEVSRITRGKIELKRESVELASIIRSAVETSQPLIDAARHRFIVSLPEEALFLDADPVRLTQVFANLLNNACKYMEPDGDIRLTAWQKNGAAVVSVQDMGIGISPEALPHVFDLFTQIDRSAGRAQGGLGIGLALARSLVQLHGGSISVRSAGLGLGSEFIVRLPLITRPADTAAAQPATTARSPRRILVVDDNRDAADSLGLLLKFLGAEIHIVYNGSSALKILDDFLPDVVLLDIGMPGMDGYEVARQIRRQPRFHDITLIALTGWGQEADRSRSQAAGFDHHLTKPANIDALQTLLASLEKSNEMPT